MASVGEAPRHEALAGQHVVHDDLLLCCRKSERVERPFLGGHTELEAILAQALDLVAKRRLGTQPLVPVETDCFKGPGSAPRGRP